MGRHAAFLDHLQVLTREFSVLEVAELLVIARVELFARGRADAARLVEQALRLYAQDVSTPDAPSDNGHGAPGDNGAVS